MFCSGFGSKLEEGASFCSGCGKVANHKEDNVQAKASSEIATEAILDENKITKNKKAIALIAMAMVAVAIFMFTRGGLSGTWASSNDREAAIIQFTRNRFTITQYYFEHSDQFFPIERSFLYTQIYNKPQTTPNPGKL